MGSGCECKLTARLKYVSSVNSEVLVPGVPAVADEGWFVRVRNLYITREKG